MFTVALASLFAQAAVVAHALLVPHTTCLEHGAVAHESGHAHAAPATPEAQFAATTQAVEVRPGDAHQLEDEHCSVLGTRHTPAPLIFAASLTEQQILAESAAREAPVVVSGRDAYRLAPKTSPPRT